MDIEKYTQKSQEALLAAQHLAQDYQHQVVEPIHVLGEIIRVEHGKEGRQFAALTSDQLVTP